MQLAASPALEGVTGKYFENGEAVEPAPLGAGRGAREAPLGGERAMVKLTA